MHRLVGLALLLALPAAVRAELRFERPEADLGEVRGGKPMTHRFAFVNDGNEIVEFLEVKPGCGCLKPRVTHLRLAPNQAGAIEVDVNTLGHLDGPHIWQTHVTYRSGTTVQELTLQLKAQIVNDVAVQPASLTLITTGAVTQDVVITDRRNSPLHITEVRPSSKSLSARTGEPYRDDAGRLACKIALEVTADCPDGRYDESLTIYTSDPDYSTLTVAVTIVKRSRQRLTVLPREVLLSATDGQALPARIVQLRDPQDVPVRIESVTTDDPSITCRWVPGPGNAATLRVQIDRTRIHGDRLQSSIHVRTLSPKGENVTIPVTCTLR
jgi:hypothetical protein